MPQGLPKSFIADDDKEEDKATMPSSFVEDKIEEPPKKGIIDRSFDFAKGILTKPGVREFGERLLTGTSPEFEKLKAEQGIKGEALGPGLEEIPFVNKGFSKLSDMIDPPQGEGGYIRGFAAGSLGVIGDIIVTGFDPRSVTVGHNIHESLAGQPKIPIRPEISTSISPEATRQPLLPNISVEKTYKAPESLDRSTPTAVANKALEAKRFFDAINYKNEYEPWRGARIIREKFGPENSSTIDIGKPEVLNTADINLMNPTPANIRRKIEEGYVLGETEPDGSVIMRYGKPVKNEIKTIPKKETELIASRPREAEVVTEETALNRSRPEKPDYTIRVLNEAGEGNPGLTVETRPSKIPALPEDTQHIIYRGSNGKPIATAKLIQDSNGKWMVEDFAADKTKGLAYGRAVKAVGEKLRELGIETPAGTVTPDAMNLIERGKKYPVIEDKPPNLPASFKADEVVEPEIIKEEPIIPEAVKEPIAELPKKYIIENAPPNQRAKMFRGAHDPVDILFPDSDSRDMFGAGQSPWSKGQIKPGVLDRLNFSTNRVMSKYGLERQEAQKAISSYNDEIKRLGKSQPKSGDNLSFEAPSFEDFIKPKKEPIELPKEPTITEKITTKLQDIEDAAVKRIKDRGTFKGGRISAGLPVDDLADFATIGAANIGKGLVKFADWSAEMVKHFGEEIKPHLEAIFKAAQAKYKALEMSGNARTVGGPGHASEYELLNNILEEANGLPNSRLTKPPSKVRQAYELTRGLMSVDIPYMTSAAFRQGVGLAGTKRWFQAIGEQARVFGNEATYNKIMNDINNNPIHTRRMVYDPEKGRTVLTSIADEIGLKSTDLKTLSRREEQIRSNLAERIPALGRYIRGSNRSYTTFLNSIRTNTADDWLKAAGVIDNNGMITDIDRARRIGNTINELTGAASLDIQAPFSRFTGSTRKLELEKSADALSLLFFSPKNLVRDARMMNPLNYIKTDKLERLKYLEGAIRRAGAWAGYTGLAALGGATVSNNITSADFGKAKIGDTRADAGSGLLQWLVLMGRQALGESTSSTSNRTRELGSDAMAQTRLSLLEDFLINRMHPTLGLGALALSASKNRPFYPISSAVEHVLPMYTNDIHELIKSNPDLRQIILGLTSGALSMGNTTYGKDDFGKPQYNIPGDVKLEGGNPFSSSKKKSGKPIIRRMSLNP